MDFSLWDAKLKQLKSNSTLLLASNLVLVSLLAASLFVHAMRQPIVVVAPMVTNEPVEIRSHSLTKSYAVSFGVSMALLLGNVTSDNAPFVLESIAHYVSPDYYASFRKDLVNQMTELKEQRIDMSFRVTGSYFDQATSQVVVQGIAVLTNPTGTYSQKKHEYRFIIEMKDYVPKMVDIQSYSYENQ